jgi:polar amino acid transport system substrate-binding protein
MNTRLERMKRVIQTFTGLALVAVVAVLTHGSLLAQEPAAGSQPALRVGVAPNMPPMIFKESNRIVGLEADLAQAVGRALGRPIQFVELRWPDLIDSLEANKIDIIMSSMSVTRARQMRVAFSDPYLRIGQMALVRADEKFRYAPLGRSIEGRTVGVSKATTADLLVQQEFPRAKRKYFDSGEAAAKALSKKKIDLYISDSTMIWYLAGRYEADGLVAAPMILSDETLAWAMRRSDADLVASVNRALKGLNESGELRRVLRRWIPRFE